MPRDGKLESAPAVEPARTALGKALMAAQDDPSSAIEEWLFDSPKVKASKWSDCMGEATRTLLAVATQAGKSSEWVARGLEAILRVHEGGWNGLKDQYVDALGPLPMLWSIYPPGTDAAKWAAKAPAVLGDVYKGLGAALEAFMNAQPSPTPRHIAQFFERWVGLDQPQGWLMNDASIHKWVCPRNLTDLLVSAVKAGWSLASCSALVDGYRAADCPDPAEKDGQAFLDWVESQRKFIGWAADELFGEMPEPTPEDMDKPWDYRAQLRVRFVRTMEGRLLPPRMPTPAPALPATSVPGQLDEAVIGKSGMKRAGS